MVMHQIHAMLPHLDRIRKIVPRLERSRRDALTLVLLVRIEHARPCVFDQLVLLDIIPAPCASVVFPRRGLVVRDSGGRHLVALVQFREVARAVGLVVFDVGDGVVVAVAREVFRRAAAAVGELDGLAPVGVGVAGFVAVVFPCRGVFVCVAEAACFVGFVA